MEREMRLWLERTLVSCPRAEDEQLMRIPVIKSRGRNLWTIFVTGLFPFMAYTFVRLSLTFSIS